MFQSAVVNSKAKMLPPIPTILFRLYTLALFYINFFNHLMLGWFGLVVLTQPSGEVVWVIKQIPFHNGKIPQFQNPQRWLTASAVIAFQTAKKNIVLVGPDVFSNRRPLEAANTWATMLEQELSILSRFICEGGSSKFNVQIGLQVFTFFKRTCSYICGGFSSQRDCRLIAESKFETFLVTQGICSKRSKWMDSLIWRGKGWKMEGEMLLMGKYHLRCFEHIFTSST